MLLRRFTDDRGKPYVKVACTMVEPRVQQATSVRRSWSELDPFPGHSERFQQRGHTDWSLCPGALQKQGPEPSPSSPGFLFQHPHCF